MRIAISASRHTHQFPLLLRIHSRNGRTGASIHTHTVAECGVKKEKASASDREREREREMGKRRARSARGERERKLYETRADI